MSLKVQPVPSGYLLVDTITHKTLGAFTSKTKAERRRHYLNRQRQLANKARHLQDRKLTTIPRGGKNSRKRNKQ